MFDQRWQRAYVGEQKSRTETIEARVAELVAVINAAHGELVDLTAVIAQEDIGIGTGVHSPAAYLGWQTGFAPARCADLVRLAERRDDLPFCVAALQAGTLTLDQASEIARHVPATFDYDATSMARRCNVRQLRKVLPAFGYGDDKTAAPARDRHGVSFGRHRDGTWSLHARGDADGGAVVETAFAAVLDDLRRQNDRDRTGGGVEELEQDGIDRFDALVSMAETALQAGEAARPGSDRYRVHLHLEAGPDTTGDPLMSWHLGGRVPHWLRQLLTCDATCQTVFHRGGAPVGVGRRTRVVSRRLRRLIEHRDRGCRIPGCHATTRLHIHHIVHWETGGPTETANLVAVCPRHHRMHHQGLLGIQGNPDHPTATPDALIITDRHGRPMADLARPTAASATGTGSSGATGPSGSGRAAASTGSTRSACPDVNPTGASPARSGITAAAVDGAQPAAPFRAPLGERIDWWGFHMNRCHPGTPLPNPWLQRLGLPPAAPPRPPPPLDHNGAPALLPNDIAYHPVGHHQHRSVGPTDDHGNIADPTRAGPTAA